MMNQIINSVLPIASVVVLVLFAIPSYLSLFRQRGLGRGLGLLIILVLITLGLEAAMVQFKFPLAYTFNNILGYRIFGLVPWVIAFTYPPIFLASFWLCRKRAEGVKLIALSSLFSLLGMIVLGAAFTRMTLIDWEPSGPLYGVPPLALIGWVVLSVLSAVFVNAIWGDEESPTRNLGYSGLGVLLFWSGVNLGLQQWIAAGVGIAMAVFMIITMFIEQLRRNKERKSERV